MANPPKLHSDEEIRANELAKIIKNEKPDAGGEKLKDIEPTPENYRKFKGDNRRRSAADLPRGIKWGAAGLVVFFIAGSIISFYVIKAKVKATIASQVGTIQAGVADLQNFDTQDAEQEFAMLSSSSSTPSWESVLGMFGFLYKGGSGAVSSFTDLAKQLTALSQEASSLESGVFSFTSSGQGGNLVTGLTQVRDTLAAIDNDSNQLSSAASLVGASASSTIGGSNFYLPLKSQIEGAENFLNVFIPWLATSTPHNVLVMLQNPSEMRPGGGFLGSYADVTLADGNITNISVHDITDVDKAFTSKIIPPPPLQLENNNFRPADANWFFDFPTSASKTIEFFEEATSTQYDAAIAISPQVVSDLLSVTGPITISSTSTASTTFTSANLLTQIQNIVQQGQDANEAGTGATTATYPKAVLGQLSHAIFQQLAASSTDAAQSQELLAMALDWVNKRDVMAYFTDPAFEGFVTSYGAGGDVYQLPQNFNGDYLALADADINSDKSDLYVAQNVAWTAQINADGTITDDVTIDKTHNGNQSPYWWYQTTNQDYLQLFVPDGAALTNEVGGFLKNITPPINYARNGYSTDPTIAAIASTTQPYLLYPNVTTHEEDGKEVFAAWTRVAKGQSTSIEFDYTHRAFLPPVAGTQYQFVFEKQAGSARSYDFTIDAPLGYVFAENGLASYQYTSDDPPGRLIITLTLEAIGEGE
jgi:hypothetical protein